METVLPTSKFDAKPWQRKLDAFVNSKGFEWFIIALILLNALALGLETYPQSKHYIGVLEWVNVIVLTVFAIEAGLKIIAVWPKPGLYFRNGWNVFDFLIVVAALLPSAGPMAAIARMMRLLRVARLITTIPELRLIVATLVRSIPSMGHIVILMSVLFYIYGVLGFYLFGEHDPEHWRDLGMAVLTLFRIVTLEDWTDVMYTAMQLSPWAWMYFVSFVVMGTFVVVNLFIAVVLNNLEEAKVERLKALQQPPTGDQLLRSLEQTREHLTALERDLARFHENHESPEVMENKKV